MKHLMVVGDDLGMSRAVNAGVRYAFDRGILTHASVLVNSPLLEETAALVRRHPPITCGIHLTLTWGLPVSSPGTIPTLTDSRPVNQHVDDLPENDWPLWEDIDFHLELLGMISFYGSRGCPHSCSYSTGRPTAGDGDHGGRNESAERHSRPAPS